MEEIAEAGHLPGLSFSYDLGWGNKSIDTEARQAGRVCTQKEKEKGATGPNPKTQNRPTGTPAPPIISLYIEIFQLFEPEDHSV